MTTNINTGPINAAGAGHYDEKNRARSGGRMDDDDSPYLRKDRRYKNLLVPGSGALQNPKGTNSNLCVVGPITTDSMDSQPEMRRVNVEPLDDNDHPVGRIDTV